MIPTTGWNLASRFGTASETATVTGTARPLGSRASWTLPSRLYLVRCGLLGLLLLGEVLLLTVRFDTATLITAGGMWRECIQFAPQLVQCAIAMAAAVCLAGRTRMPGYVRDFCERGQSDSSGKYWAVAQLFAFSSLVAVTDLLEGGPERITVAGPLWGVLILASGVCWLAAVAPLDCWLRFARCEYHALLLGGLIGLGSTLLGKLAQGLWEPLGDMTLLIVTSILHLLFPTVIVEPATRIVGTQQFQVQIAPQCSGYEGVGLILVFLTAFSLLFRAQLRFPQAWLLWPVGIVTIWLSNAVRIALLIMVGTMISPEIALGGFHSQAGWIFFNLVALALMGTALHLPFFVKQSDVTPAGEGGAPVVGYLLPFLALTAANLLAAAFSSGFDWWYPGKVLITVATILAVVPATQWTFPRPDLKRLVAFWPAVLNGMLVFVLWIAIADRSELQLVRPTELQTASPLIAGTWILFRVIGSVLTVPLVEEWAFRGYLLRRMASPMFDRVAYRAAPLWTVAASSLLFGLMHQRWLAGTLAGLAYAVAARRRNSLADAVVAHAVTNGLIALAVLGFGAWGLW